MKHDELVNCWGTKDSSCYWLFIFTSWGAGDAGQNKNWKHWDPFFWLCWYWRLQRIEPALIKISALLKQEFEKRPSPSLLFLFFLVLFLIDSAWRPDWTFDIYPEICARSLGAGWDHITRQLLGGGTLSNSAGNLHSSGLSWQQSKLWKSLHSFLKNLLCSEDLPVLSVECSGSGRTSGWQLGTPEIGSGFRPELPARSGP